MTRELPPIGTLLTTKHEVRYFLPYDLGERESWMSRLQDMLEPGEAVLFLGEFSYISESDDGGTSGEVFSRTVYGLKFLYGETIIATEIDFEKPHPDVIYNNFFVKSGDD